ADRTHARRARPVPRGPALVGDRLSRPDPSLNPMACRIRIEPLGVDISVEAGEPVMAAALRQGLRWPTACHGQAQCSLCAVKVLDGLDALEAPGALERAALAQYRGVDCDQRPEIRLACQVRVFAPAVLRKPGVSRADGEPDSPM